MNEIYNSTTVLDSVLRSQPYKTEDLIRRQNDVYLLTNKRMVEEQEKLLKEQKAGSYAYEVLENSIRELKDNRSVQRSLEQQLQNWRDSHEEYVRVRVQRARDA